MASKDKDKNPTGTYRSRSGGIRTLAYLNRHTGPGSDSDPKKHYTGGNKRDRVEQDPTKGNDVDGILDQAKQMGAVEKPFDMYTPPSPRSRKSLSGPAAPPQPVPVSHHIVFWHNGFTVNNGPLRRIDDPRNASFLMSVKNSECPKELEPADKRTTVHVNLVKKGEKYVEPRRTRRRVGFQGKGRSLGSRPSKSAFSFTPFVSAPAPAPAFSLVIDEAKPTTCIELRLADGTRMIGCFNHHHTISYIRGLIDSSRPGQSRNYELHAVWFTPKLLNDPNQTIEQAGLANSVVIQKL